MNYPLNNLFPLYGQIRKEIHMVKKLQLPPTFEQFTAIRRYGYGALSFSPDGSEIVYTVNTSGQYNAWKQPAVGGFPHQLTTFSERAVRIVAWSPDGAWIAYSSDHHGDEFYQLFMISAQGGQPIQLTEKTDVWHEFSQDAWSPNGRYLAYSANDRDREAMDILVLDLKKDETKRVLAGDANYFFSKWAPNGRLILGYEMVTSSDINIFLIDARNGTHRLLTPHEGEIVFLPGPWAPDSSGFYFLTDMGKEFIGMGYFDLKENSWRWVENPEWDIEYVSGSRNGQYLAWVVNEDGFSKLNIRNQDSGKLLDLPVSPKGIILNPTFSPMGDKLAFLQLTPTHCAEIMVLDLTSCTSLQLTSSMLGGIRENTLIMPRLVRYPTHDGRKVPAWLFKPKRVEAGRRLPVLLSIHGGPEAQERPMYIYSGLYQYILSKGIGVLAPNIRGSTGFGKTYQKLIHHDWGGGELRDVEYAVKYLYSLDWVDPERIGIFGASYGGFATLSAITRLPDYWAAAVDIVGPSNLVTLIKTGPPYWRRWDSVLIGDPDTEADFLLSRSPIQYVNQVKTPLYIIQGAQDPRVPKSESDQFVETLRARGVDVRYDIYDDEGHGFTKRENELKAWRGTATFFETHLLPEEQL